MFKRENLFCSTPSDKTSDTTKGRIAYLDALRGLAILGVLLFHGYARWPELVPFGDQFSHVRFLVYGGVGVELFYLISGYVILMTLEKCRNFPDFMLRRWLRLFPASLICSVFIFATASFFPERPLGLPVFKDMVPGLVFIQPEWIGFLLHSGQGSLEGSFWTIYIEVIFYVVFGALFFLIGKKRAIGVMVLMFLGGFAGRAFNIASLKALDDFFRMIFWGWFMVGALLYLWSRTRDTRTLCFALILSAFCPWSFKQGEGMIEASFVLVLFFLAVTQPRVQKILANRLLLWIGFISYPLYLVHENMLVALLVKMGRVMPYVPHVIMPLLPMAGLMGLSWGVAAYGEPAVRQLLKKPYGIMRKIAGAV